MKNSILTVMKKELFRFIGDKRILFGSVLLPGILIFLVYSFMGNAMESTFAPQDAAPKIAAVEAPPSIAALFDAQDISYESIDASSTDIIDDKMALISAKDFDLLIVFPADFDALVKEYDVGSGALAPDIQVFYNSADSNSSQLYSQMITMFDAYESTLANKFDVNDGPDIYDLAQEKDLSGRVFASMMPLLLTIFLFSGCMAVAPESIAGEKERGTLSTLLVTPLRRRELALGKIFAITIIATLSAISSTIGTVLSLPKLMGGAEQLDVFYTASDYLLLAIVILSTVLLFVSLISILSALAKSIKEAQTYVMPLMVVVMLVGVSGMFGITLDNPAVYLIPVYNSVQCMSAVFSFEVTQLNVAITFISNLIYCGVLAFVLTKMFNSEKIMFSR